jgi:hypothetical protein
MSVIIYSNTHGRNGGPALNALAAITLLVSFIVATAGFLGYRWMTSGESKDARSSPRSPAYEGGCSGSVSDEHGLACELVHAQRGHNRRRGTPVTGSANLRRQLPLRDQQRQRREIPAERFLTGAVDEEAL